MGGCSVSGIVRGKDFEAAMSKLQGEMRSQYGWDGYNGTVSTIDHWENVTYRLDGQAFSVRQFVKHCKNRATSQRVRDAINSYTERVNKREGVYVRISNRSFAYYGIAAC